MPSAIEPPEKDAIHVWRIELGAGGRAAARAALGRILGGYLGGRGAPRLTEAPTGKPRLTIAPGGKPRLAEDPGRLSFNLAHSGALVLVAIAPGGVEVGVDVERLRARRDLVRLAARWLPAADAAAVAVADPGERERVFYAAWTAHEARVKCTGAGLAGSPPESAVNAWPLEVDPAYAAAVAVAAPTEPRIVRRNLPVRTGPE